MAKANRRFRPAEGDFAPEWFYPLARIVHEQIRNVVGVEPVLKGMEPEGCFRSPVNPEKLEGFTLKGEKGDAVYWRGIVHLYDDLFFRYAKRAPKRRFMEFFNGPAELVLSDVDGESS